MLSEALTVEQIRERVVASIDCHRHDPVSAIALASDAIAGARAIQNWLEEAQGLRARGMAYGAHGEIDRAADDFLAGLALARQIGDLLCEANCLHGIATAHHYRGDFALALETSYECVAIRREIGSPRPLANALVNLGGFHGSMGNYADSSDCLTEALQLARQVEDIETELLCLGNIGLLHLECGEPDMAVDFLQESVALAHRNGDPAHEAMNRENLANALTEAGRIDEAVIAAGEAVVLAKRLDNPHRLVPAMTVYGSALRQAGCLDDAREVLEKTLSVARSLGSTRALIPALEAHALLLRDCGEIDAASDLLTEALARADEQHVLSAQVTLHESLADVCEARKEYGAALFHHRRFHELHTQQERQSAHYRMIAQMSRLEVERAKQETDRHRQRAVELSEAVQERAALLQEIERQRDRFAREALEDALTGLYNRRYLDDYLEREIARLQRGGGVISVLVIDIDNFKTINDQTHSHQIGDRVLGVLADILREIARRSDIPIRLGGEEFVLIMPESGSDAARVCAERLRATVEKRAWNRIAPSLRVTVSIGIAQMRPDRAISPAAAAESLIGQADQAMYVAKRAGKNRVAEWAVIEMKG